MAHRSNDLEAAEFEKELKEAGFRRVEAREEKHNRRMVNMDVFIAMASAAPLIRAEFNALSEESRAKIISEALEGLHSFQAPGGFEWTYDVLAVLVQK